MNFNVNNLNFAMAKYEREDSVLRAIAKEALNFLSKHVDTRRIECILLTGSVANGEGTVIVYDKRMVASDFDFIIYMSLTDFLRNRTYLANLSQQLTTRLMKKGVNVHITFVPSTSVLQASPFFVKSDIYEYEFAFASKCLFGKTPQFDKNARPTKRDALELTFTVVSDLIFTNFKNGSKIEESYIYAKRALTLLNSILIFHGFFAETYQKRIEIAKKYAEVGTIPISHDEIKTLEIFTKYKLSGSLQHLLDSFSYKKVDDIVSFQKEFLKKLAAKILYYELMYLTSTPTGTKLTYNNSPLSRMPKLLREYSKHCENSFFNRISGFILYLFWSFSRDMKRKEIFAAYIFHKQSPKAILNVLTTLFFMYGRRISMGRILREIFPWINVNETNAIQKLFSLRQIAEQSLKLN